MGCNTTALKTAFIILNICCGIYFLGRTIFLIDQGQADYIPYVLCGFAILLAILGCLAAIRESVPLLALCAVCLLIWAIAEIAVTCWHVQRYTTDSTEVVNDAWDRKKMDELQTSNECCGKDSAQDYVLHNRPIPLSCFKHADDSVAEDLYMTGCIAKLLSYDEAVRMNVIIYTSIFIGLQLLGVVLAALLVIKYRNKQRRMQF